MPGPRKPKVKNTPAQSKNPAKPKKSARTAVRTVTLETHRPREVVVEKEIMVPQRALRQQTTQALTRSAGGLSGQALQLYLAMTDSSRVACQLGGESAAPTEAICFSNTKNLDLSAGNGAGSEIPSGSGVILKRRDSMLCSAMYYVGPQAGTISYVANFYTNGNLNTSKTLTAGRIVSTVLSPVFFAGAASSHHGPRMYMGRDAYKHKWFWVSASETITVTHTPYATGAWYITPERYMEGADPLQANTVILAAGGGTTTLLTAITSGFYRLCVSTATPTTADTTLTALSINRSASYGGFAIRAIPQIEMQYTRVESFRNMGASLLVSPHPSVTNLAGDVIQMQYAAGTGLYPTLTFSYQTAGESSGKAKQPRSLYKGAYSFVRPADAYEDFRMAQEIDLDTNGIICDATFDIVPRSPFVVHYLSNLPAVGSPAAYPSAVFQVTFGDSVNLTSVSQWAALGTPNGTDSDFNRALKTVKNMENHLENPTHLEDIWRGASGVFRTVGGVAQALAPLAGQYGPLLGAAGSLGQIVGSL